MYDRQFRELILRSFNWPVQLQTISQILPSVAWHTTENNSLGLGQLTTERCDMLTLDTLISICICPYCFLDIFLKVPIRRICLTINWFPHCWLYLFSYGLDVWFKGDLWEDVNPFTPTSDQDRISPYNINTISSRQVMRIEKNVNHGIISWSNTKFSELTS